MSFDISLKTLKKFLKSEGVKLTSEEKNMINSVWDDVDLYDKDGNYKPKGDGRLNVDEWVRFKTEIQKACTTLYDKLTNFINNTNGQIEYERDYNHTAERVFDSGKYEIETLKKLYPEKNYVIEEKEENSLKSIVVTRKNDGKEVLTVESDAFGNNKVIHSKDGGNLKWIYLYDDNNRIIKEEFSRKRNEYIYDTKVLAMYDYSSNLKKCTNGNLYDLYTGRLVRDQDTIYHEDGSYEKLNFETGEKVFYDKKGKVIKVEMSDEAFNTALARASSEDSASKYDFLIDKLLHCENIYDVLVSHKSINNLTSYLEELSTNINEIYEQDSEKANNLSKKLLEKIISDAQKQEVYIDDFKEDFDKVLKSDSTTLRRISYTIKRLIARVKGVMVEDEVGNADGKINSESKFNQGIVGNCWLIADLKSILKNDKALEELNKLITVQKDANGNIVSETVKIQGKDYVIPLKEMLGAEELSSGDLEIRAIELAVYKYLDDINMDHRAIGTGLTTEDYFYDRNPGGTTGLGIDILFGNGGEIIKNGASIINSNTTNIDDSFVNKMSTGENLLITCSTNESGFFAKNIETNEKVEISPNHAYTVLKTIGGFVHVQNPMESDQVLVMTLNEFKLCFKQGNIYDFS